jgi:tryptophan synthase alpha chain
MSRISETFTGLKGKKEAALIPYIMAGDPDLATTKELIFEMERSGADMVELGVPFSDPLADGPTIQRAAIRALKSRATLASVFKLVSHVRKTTEIPIILMLYYNLILKYGEERFAADAAMSGVDGVIVPDLPPEEASLLMKAAKKSGLDMIFLLAPTSSPDRIRLVSECASGFIYYVSLTGVTGARKALDSTIEASLRKIRRVTKKPLCVGFGISGPKQAKQVAAWADGVIVGSAIVGLVEKAGSRQMAVKEVGPFIRALKKACR